MQSVQLNLLLLALLVSIDPSLAPPSLLRLHFSSLSGTASLAFLASNGQLWLRIWRDVAWATSLWSSWTSLINAMSGSIVNWEAPPKHSCPYACDLPR
jgi:hypothetical protein